jgi:hypothetical protein
MRSSFKPKNPESNPEPKKTVTFVDYPEGRPPEGYEADDRIPTTREFMILSRREIEELEGPIGTEDPRTPNWMKPPDPVLSEEDKTSTLLYIKGRLSASKKFTYSVDPRQRMLQRYNDVVEVILKVPLNISAAQNTNILTRLQGCSDDSIRRNLEDVCNNLEMEELDDDDDEMDDDYLSLLIEMGDCLSVLKKVFDKKLPISEQILYQIEKAWRLLFQLRCEHFHSSKTHQINDERLEYINNKLKLEAKPANSVLSSFVGSPVRTSGDAFALLIRKINRLLAKNDFDSNLSTFIDEIFKGNFGNALVCLCYEDIQIAMPLVGMLLESKLIGEKDINRCLLCASQQVKEHGDTSLYYLLVQSGADKSTRDDVHSAEEYLEEWFRSNPVPLALEG